MYPEFTVISFDNSSYGYADGIVDDEQLQWLAEMLEEYKRATDYTGNPPPFTATAK